MSEDPYRPPTGDPAAPPDEPGLCPTCGGPLEKGKVWGNLHWLDQDASALRRFVGGRKIVGPRPFSITLGQPSTIAWRCVKCQLTLMYPEK